MKKIILTLSLLLFACNQDTKEKLVVYQSPSCGCCSGWVANMEENGFNVEVYPTDAKLKKQFGYADKKNIPNTIVIGADEIAENFVSLKNMETGEQKKVSIEEVITILS